jgi:hypothetical protein
MDIPKGIIFDHNKKFEQFLNNDKVFYYYENTINNYIILTDKRFIKIENNKILSEVSLDNIKNIYHRNNSIFYWDSIEITKNDNIIETFGIKYKNIAEFFTNLLKNIEIIKSTENNYIETLEIKDEYINIEKSQEKEKKKCFYCKSDKHFIRNCLLKLIKDNDFKSSKNPNIYFKSDYKNNNLFLRWKNKEFENIEGWEKYDKFFIKLN